MLGELCATVGTTDFVVHVEPATSAGGQWYVTVDGKKLAVDAVRIKDDTWSLLLNGRSYVIDVDAQKRPPVIHTHRGITPVTVQSAQHKRLADQAKLGRTAKPKNEAITADIAGRVIKVLVDEGDIVPAGAGVIILEAMKMENEIKCVRGGKVTRIAVQAGQSVETGAALLNLSPVE